MRFYFNNCRCRPHKSLFGADAFFDLNITGAQAGQATNISEGDECIVATYTSEAKTHVRFDKYEFKRQAIMTAAGEAEAVRVFFGRFLGDVTMTKEEAGKSDDYKLFFSREGAFKQMSVV